MAVSPSGIQRCGTLYGTLCGALAGHPSDILILRMEIPERAKDV
jgi:hypothetical protein